MDDGETYTTSLKAMQDIDSTKFPVHRKKLVIFIHLGEFGGIETVLIVLLKELARVYDCYILSSNAIPQRFIAFFDSLPGVVYHAVVLNNPKVKFWHPVRYIHYKYVKCSHCLLPVSQEVRDIILNSDMLIDFCGGWGYRWYAGLPKRVPYLLWLHGGIPYVQEVMERKVKFDLFDKIICLTDTFADLMRKTYPQYAEKFIRIYNPLDMKAVPEKNISRVPDYPYFLHVGRVHTDKDYKTLIDGFAGFHAESGSQTRLLIVGDGKQLPYWKKYVRWNKLEGYVVFAGYQAEPYDYMKYAKACVLSSRAEGLPTVLLEFLNHGQGVVVSSDCVAGPSEILMDGRCGALYKPGDSEGLKNVLLKIDRGEMSREIFAPNIPQSLERFTVPVVFRQIQNLIETLTGVQR